MSKLAGFETSGSIHLITNNLIGFTAENTSAGSTFSVGDIGMCRSEEVYTLKEMCPAETISDSNNAQVRCMTSL